MTLETVGVRDRRFIAFVNFLLALLWLETAFFPEAPLWSRVSIASLVVFWNGINLFVWTRSKVPIKKEKPE